MKIFSESGLTFKFPENWLVFKYDKHRFYKGLSGQGLRAVDFLAIKNLEKLVLIEVKNFEDRFEKDGVNPTHYFFENQESFFDAFVDKFEDSVRGIQIIHKYYQRKWWFRKLAIPFSRQCSKKWWVRFEWGIWLLAHELSQKEAIQQVVSIHWDKGFEINLATINADFNSFLKKENIQLPGTFHILNQTDFTLQNTDA